MRRPPWVPVVDDESVAVPVMTLKVRMIRWQVVVGVLDLRRVPGWPKMQRADDPGTGDSRQHDQCGDCAEPGHQPAGQWIAE